ncbi:cobyrinate a,c-diamide synthase [Candidatus Thiosymbion oneisti]|uniref:cobyrinate a,c-diamide synthase n=1 Tax=Candidatus Thiosymbion oneisti TaxID=589554 RepID=UPI000AB6DD12|nr:cobyrinate a,c-diamide synthase [Candidatus Thiosymbion oneisti]
MRRCPALFISGPASNSGKTTVTAALARWCRDCGRTVRVFKTGPDFLDPMILERASGAPVYNLDLFMGGERHCRRLLYEAAGPADLILIEGVMGLFDGDPSSADLATRFGIPVLAVIDGSAMAQTFGAVAHGLATYRREVPFAGVLANNVAGAHHYRLLTEALPAGIGAFGWLARDAGVALPERHLGLVQADEIEDLEARIRRAAAALRGFDGHGLGCGGHSPPYGVETALEPIEFAQPEQTPLPSGLEGRRIAIARDRAFAFLYRANLDLLRDLGARLVFFSPLADDALPDADALYLPGGYPELHLERLAANRPLKAAVRAHHAAGRPIVAECGGMLYLLESLTDVKGHRADMVGLLPGRALIQKKLANLGVHRVRLTQGVLRGHTFHYSRLELALTPVAWSQGRDADRRGEPIYREDGLLASYLHFYFPSNPGAVVQLFNPAGTVSAGMAGLPNNHHR